MVGKCESVVKVVGGRELVRVLITVVIGKQAINFTNKISCNKIGPQS